MRDEARFKYFLNIEFDFINYPFPFILLYTLNPSLLTHNLSRLIISLEPNSKTVNNLIQKPNPFAPSHKPNL